MTQIVEPGELIGPVNVDRIAHGGHGVARHDGRVVFVRHAVPGEQVMVRVTDTSHDRYWSGDAVTVLMASEHRVEPGCVISGPGGCGGCDFQHISPDHQRELKRQVVAEQLDRLAGLDWDGIVEEGPTGAGDGVAWRTRTRWFGAGEAWGLRAHHSHRVVPLPAEGCQIALAGPPTTSGRVADVTLASDGSRTETIDDVRVSGTSPVVQRADGRDHWVAADGFWQVHPRAADILVAAVIDGLQPEVGERAVDLYCGVGLFAGALDARGLKVWGVEAGWSAIELARRNVPGATFRAGRVERSLAKLPADVDLVVLDPPRKGARRPVMEAVLALAPRRIAYVACDPSALARDLAIAAEHGWRAAGIRAFDLFPMTHHVECVAVLEPRHRSQ